MRTIEKYIFMLCPFCKRMSIIKRQNYDPKDAIWCTNACGCNSEKFEGEEYYKQEGQIINSDGVHSDNLL